MARNQSFKMWRGFLLVVMLNLLTTTTTINHKSFSLAIIPQVCETTHVRWIYMIVQIQIKDSYEFEKSHLNYRYSFLELHLKVSLPMNVQYRHIDQGCTGVLV